MASEIIVKIYEVDKNTNKTKNIRMFQADQKILNSFSDFREKVFSLFGYGIQANIFWKGR